MSVAAEGHNTTVTSFFCVRNTYFGKAERGAKARETMFSLLLIAPPVFNITDKPDGAFLNEIHQASFFSYLS